MSTNHTDNNFSKDFGKVIPVNADVWMRPRNHRFKGLKTGVHTISTISLSHCEFCVAGGWYRMTDYVFGAVEGEEA